MRSVLLIAPLLLCADPAAAQVVGAPVQSIALYSYGFNPTPIVLNAGKAVTLSFVNRAGKSHDFTAEKFFRASKILSGKVGEGEVDLAPGQTASVTLIPAAGRYKAHCGHPFHKMLGMHTDIIVR
ncbi:cupredoxin domain-containing protein [Sphingomonas sediminicola]|uniref:cupredoxin domain-containing protein n=1 Tax=Sphingomonas sediminicola TaxID=386874 RepID=UPI003CEAB1A0